jgi:hypothetical protein
MPCGTEHIASEPSMVLNNQNAPHEFFLMPRSFRMMQGESKDRL